MRFSIIIAACVVPFAMAGTLQSGLAARGVAGVNEISVRTDHGKSEGEGGHKGGDANVKVINVIKQASPAVVVLWVNNGGGATTQTMIHTVTTAVKGQEAVSTVSAAQGAGRTHSVMVGGTPGLVYSPDSIKADVGDTVEFTFKSNNHTVTQSSFDLPCKKLADGMDTGFVPNVNNTISPPPQMAMQVMGTEPIWFYCRQATHCGKGMAFSINDKPEKSHAQFQSAAIAQNGTGVLAAIQGGTASTAATESAAATNSVVAPPPSGASMAAGTGTLQNGQCSCSCLCGVGQFAKADIQGRGAFGGMPGMIPISAMEKTA